MERNWEGGRIQKGVTVSQTGNKRMNFAEKVLHMNTQKYGHTVTLMQVRTLCLIFLLSKWGHTHLEVLSMVVKLHALAGVAAMIVLALSVDENSFSHVARTVI